MRTIILACASGSDGQSDDTSTTAPRGPQAGAPDEHCNLDPDRVYLIETPEPLITYTSLTDLGSSGPAFASSPRTRARRKQLGWNAVAPDSIAVRRLEANMITHRFTWGDTVRVRSSAPPAFHPGELVAVCGVEEVTETERARVLGVEPRAIASNLKRFRSYARSI